MTQTRREFLRAGALGAAAGLLPGVLLGQTAKRRAGPVTFEKVVLADEYFADGINYGDINRDGHMDIVAGPFWYEGPDFKRRHRFYETEAVPPTTPASSSMFTFVYDFNGDGRLDLVLYNGWWEQPAEPGKLWTPHPMKFGPGRGGAQMLIYDVDGDGLADVVSSIDAHRWGLSWFQQVLDARGNISFTEHRIMGDRSEEAKFGVAFSQPHALCMADIDGDGLMDVIVSKRRWAHGPEGDVEPNAPPVVYWFQLTRDPVAGVKFIPHLVDDHSGGGVQIAAGDVTGDGVPDILTASKLGAFLFITHRS